MKQQPSEVRVYLFHIITAGFYNFHGGFCGVPRQALIRRQRSSGEMTVLDEQQTLEVKLCDESEGVREGG